VGLRPKYFVAALPCYKALDLWSFENSLAEPTAASNLIVVYLSDSTQAPIFLVCAQLRPRDSPRSESHRVAAPARPQLCAAGP